jgi:alpha-glucan phosphorylase-like protein
VGAGNPGVSRSLLETYAQYYADKMDITIDQLLSLGIEDDPDRFMVTRFALNTSRKASGVSQPHTALSEQAWPEYNWTNITNGVHLGTWQDKSMAAADKVDDHNLWQRHLDLKYQSMEAIQQWTGFGYDSNWLILGWARRIAGYKHLDWVFSDVQRLATILKNQDRPAMLLVSGKAHHTDQQGKLMLQKFIQHMQQELSGHALYIPNYNIEIAAHLTRGVDVWLNTPELGMEASGTSGMKAASNGVLNCTVPDGWAAEVDWPDKGWALDGKNVATDLYRLLEEEITPLYYQRSDNVPTEWVKKMRASLSLAKQYSARRMVRQYREELYHAEGE